MKTHMTDDKCINIKCDLISLWIIFSLISLSGLKNKRDAKDKSEFFLQHIMHI